MMNFQVGTCDLKTKKDNLEAFAKDNYLRFYNKDKLRHATRGDKRLPRLKITDDIFSLQIWFKDKFKNEHRIFIDGFVSLESLKIHTITIDKYSFNEFEYNIFLEILKGLSKISEGYILVSTDGNPQRISKGQMQQYDSLLGEIYSNLPEDKKSEVKHLFDWMINTNNDK